MPPRLRVSMLLATSVLAFAAFLRLAYLSEMPPGLYYDEGIKSLQAYRLFHFGLYPYFQDPLPTESLYEVTLAPFVGLGGATAFSGHLYSAILGLLGVALTYQAGRAAAPHPASRTASGLIAAGVLTVLVGHITLSRMTLRAIMLPTFEAATLAAVLIGWRKNNRRWFVLAGVLGAVATIEVYLPGLVILPTLLAALAHQAVFARAEFRARLKNIGVFVAVLIGLTLAIYAAKEAATPGPFFDRVTNASAVPTSESVGGTLTQYSKALMNSASQLFLKGDPRPKNNVASAPVMPAGLAVLAAAGVLVLLTRWRSLASVLLIGLLISMILPAALSVEPIEGRRIIGEFVVLALLAAAAGCALLDIARARLGADAHRLGSLALAGMIAFYGTAAGALYVSYFRDPANYELDNYYNFITWFQVRPLALADEANRAAVPTYLPLNMTNQPAVRFVLGQRYGRSRSYVDLPAVDGRLQLPDGQVLLPLRAGNRAPDPDGTLSYVLLMPTSGSVCCGELYILPPLSGGDANALVEQVAQQGTDIDANGDLIGRRLVFAGDDNPFRRVGIAAHALDIQFGPHLNLVGWSGKRALQPGNTASITLLWQSGVDTNFPELTERVQLIDPSRMGVSNPVESNMLWAAFGPAEWRKGDLIPITHRIETPANLAPGVYGLAVSASTSRVTPLPAYNANGEPVESPVILWEWKVPLPAQELPSDIEKTNITLGDQIDLLGYTVMRGGDLVKSSDLSGGGSVTLTLYWRASEPVSARYHIFVHVQSASSELLDSLDGPPLDDRYPTSIWDAGEIVATTHTLNLPADPSGVSISVGMYGWPDLIRLAVTQDGKPIDDSRGILWQFPN